MVTSVFLFMLLSGVEHITLEFTGGNVQTFFAPISSGIPLVLFVIDDNRFIIQSVNPIRRHEVFFEAGTTAIDVSDINQDGKNELLAVSGNNILAYSLSPDGEPSSPRLLFTKKSLFSIGSMKPTAIPLVFPFNGEHVIGLPTESAFELLRQDGTVIKSFLVQEGERNGSEFGNSQTFPFTYSSGSSEVTAFGFRVRHVEEKCYDFPSDLRSSADFSLQYRKVPSHHYANLDPQDYTSWPWFFLSALSPGEGRVYYAWNAPGFNNSRIIVSGPIPDMPESDAKGVGSSYPLVYPGRVMPLEEMLPDFDGDGFTDLVLWSAPNFPKSLDLIPKIIRNSLINVKVCVHLFLPKKRRYASKATATIDVQVPIHRLIFPIEDNCLENVVFNDFNGDGCTDCSWSPRGTDYEIWLWHKERSTLSLSQKIEFPRKIDKIEHCIDFDGKGNTSLVVRVGNVLHIIYFPVCED